MAVTVDRQSAQKSCGTSAPQKLKYPLKKLLREIARHSVELNEHEKAVRRHRKSQARLWQKFQDGMKERP